MDLELIKFDEPSETRHFEKGRFDVYRVGPAVLGGPPTSRGGAARSTLRRTTAPSG